MACEWAGATGTQLNQWTPLGPADVLVDVAGPANLFVELRGAPKLNGGGSQASQMGNPLNLRPTNGVVERAGANNLTGGTCSGQQIRWWYPLGSAD